MHKTPLTIAIVAGGILHQDFLPQIKRANYIIGVDFGAYWLLEQGITPNMAIGDFDSVNKKEMRQIEINARNIIRYPVKKDETDLDLAIGEAIKQKPTEVWIFGALGTRFDHSYAGILMLARLESHNICGYLVDKTNKIHIVRRPREKFSRNQGFRYVSFFSLTKIAVITLKGFAYDGKKIIVSRESSLGVSNEIKKIHATISVYRGSVLAVQSRD
jgi:thiamine pyrophosphokinase